MFLYQKRRNHIDFLRGHCREVFPKNWKSFWRNSFQKSHSLDQEVFLHLEHTPTKLHKPKSLSHVQLFVTPWTYQAPPSMGFSRQEYWSGLPFPSPGDLPEPGIKPRSPALQTDVLTSEPPGKPKPMVLSTNNRVNNYTSEKFPKCCSMEKKFWDGRLWLKMLEKPQILWPSFENWLYIKTY